MPKIAIGVLYFFYILFILIGIVVFILDPEGYHKNMMDAQNDVKWCLAGSPSDPSLPPNDCSYQDDRNFKHGMELLTHLLIPFAIATIFGMIAWIGTLVNLGKAQAWIWFILAFFFGGIVILIYLIAGPKSAAKQSLQMQQAPVYPIPAYQSAVSSPPPQMYQAPPQLSALEVLQQRFAHGEIDAATYQQMRDMLKS